VAVHPAARRRPKPRSGPRRHDGCGYFIASVTHRRTLPVPQPRCPIASERWCYAARPAELTSSKTARATLRRLQSSIHHLLRRSAHHSPAPPRRQIAIDGHRPRRPPRVPSLEAFGRRPSARVDRSRRASIRNPSHEEPFQARTLSGRVGSGSGRRLPNCEMAPVTPFQPLPDAGRGFAGLSRLSPGQPRRTALWSRAAQIIRLRRPSSNLI
jgi:hypothetical protein